MIERRLKVRFPIIEAARYRLRDGKRRLISGIGQTVNFSSSGALLRMQHPVRLFQPMEMAVEWPFRLDNHIHLQVVAAGRVVRVESGCVAIHFDRHEFRTSRAAKAS